MHFLFFLFYVDISLSTTLVQQRFSHGSIDPRCATRAKKNATSKDRTRETGRLKNIQKEQSVSRYLRRDKFLRASFLAILTFLFHFLKKNKKNRHLRRFIQFATSKVRLNSPRYFPFPSFISPGNEYFSSRRGSFYLTLPLLFFPLPPSLFSSIFATTLPNTVVVTIKFRKSALISRCLAPSNAEAAFSLLSSPLFRGKSGEVPFC